MKNAILYTVQHSVHYTECVLHKPITVQGGQGMKKIDFKEKMRASSHLHELLIYDYTHFLVNL